MHNFWGFVSNVSVVRFQHCPKGYCRSTWKLQIDSGDLYQGTFSSCESANEMKGLWCSQECMNFRLLLMTSSVGINLKAILR